MPPPFHRRRPPAWPNPANWLKLLPAAGVRSLQSTRVETILAWARNAPQSEGDPQVRRGLSSPTDRTISPPVKAARSPGPDRPASAAAANALPGPLRVSPGSVVTAAEFAAEAGPITAYASSAIKGRRAYVSTHRATRAAPPTAAMAPRSSKGNRRLKAAILRIARHPHARRQRSLRLQRAGSKNSRVKVRKPRSTSSSATCFARIASTGWSPGGKTYRHPGDRATRRLHHSKDDPIL